MHETGQHFQLSPTDDRSAPSGGPRRKPADPDAHYDLCTTCDFQHDCLRRRTLIRPVHFCEEFATHAWPDENPYTTPLRPAPPASAIEKPRYSGLCMNCDHRGHCRLACTEGGIWHCEEYS